MRNMLTWPSPSKGMLPFIGRILPVGADAIEGAVDIQGDFALDVAVANVTFRAENDRRRPAPEGSAENERFPRSADGANGDSVPATALVPALPRAFP